MTNPVMFYLHEHGPNGEDLESPTLDSLIERSSVVFREVIVEDLDKLNREEEEINKALRNRELNRLDQYSMAKSMGGIWHLLKKLEGKDKRIVFERTKATKEVDQATELIYTLALSFFVVPITPEEFHYEVINEDLKYIKEINRQREIEIAEQIVAINEPIVALFGASHISLVKEVSKKRVTEIHYPFEKNYRIAETMQRMIDYDAPEIDKESLIKFCIELYVKGVLTKEPTNYLENRIIAEHYTDLIQLDQAVRLRDRVLSEISKYKDALGVVYAYRNKKTFDEFLITERLPEVREVVKQLNLSPSQVSYKLIQNYQT